MKGPRSSDFASLDVHTLDHVTKAMEYEFRKRVRKERREKVDYHAAAAATAAAEGDR